MVDKNPLPEQSVKIFPNPTSDIINVEIEFDQPKQTTIFIADAQGKILMADTRKRLISQRIDYDLSQYPSGNYIVRVSTLEGTKTEHVLVTH